MRSLQVATALLMLGASLALLVNSDVLSAPNVRLGTSIAAVAVIILGATALGLHIGRAL